MGAASVLIVDDAYAAAALLPLSFSRYAALPDGTPLSWHIARSVAEAQAWLGERQAASVVLAIVDLDLGPPAGGAALVPYLRVSPAMRGDSCIIIWSSRDEGAGVARAVGADAFVSKQRMGRAQAPGSDMYAIVERLWHADMRSDPRPWIVRA